MQLMRWQTLHHYRTRLLIEETQHVKMSHMKLGKEPHAARKLRVGHPCFRPKAYFSDPGEIDLKQEVFSLHPNVRTWH